MKSPLRNTIDFLALLAPGDNRIYEILKMEKDGVELTIVVRCSDDFSACKSVHFTDVSSFAHTLFGAPEDSEQLPQSLIGFDYWSDDDSPSYRWEINGDECTWNFIAAAPTVENC